MERPPIRALDTGAGGWSRVDVVLRPTGPPDAEGLVAAVTRALDAVDGPEHGRDPVIELSYDFSPPEGELGVALWVRAVSIGVAVDAATTFVIRCAAEAGMDGTTIWDIRALPHEAVLEQRADWP